MYRPPDNCNRVKSIRDMFENGALIHNNPNRAGHKLTKTHITRNGPTITPKSAKKPDCGAKVSPKDEPVPPKMSLHVRSRARNDTAVPKSPSKKDCTPVRPKMSQDMVVGRKNQLNLTRQLSDPSKSLKRTPAFRLETTGSNFEHKVKQFNSVLKNCDSNTRPPLIKSKSSHDFGTIRAKCAPNPLDLYTDPIPKSQRALKDEVDSPHKKLAAMTLKVRNTALKTADIHKASTLKLSSASNLSDTLKAALLRPLPLGPPPKKPPRTFTHLVDESPVKKDARYMLNKLENALKSNKIRTGSGRKTKEVIATTTSGEDSDDSLLFKSKQSTINLNCINCQSDYEPVAEAKSSFFVGLDRKSEEPVYAQPFQDCSSPTTRNKEFRNSLYYMSSPVLCDSLGEPPQKMDENDNNSVKKMSAENSSSLSSSSFTSDLDSCGAESTSQHQEKQHEQQSSRDQSIRHLIDRFEDRRMDDLKDSLQRTLDRFCTLDDSEDDDEQNTAKRPNRTNSNNNTSNSKERKRSFEKIFDKFETYVRTMPKYRRCTVAKDDRLFYCCLIVGWDSRHGPRIKFKMPSNVTLPARIEDLCFPEAASGPLDKSNNAQCYSLVIMNDRGERTFGYCRRVMPEGSNRCIPLVYCILSKHRAPHFYRKILQEIEARHGIPEKMREQFLADFYCKRFPKPGESVRIELAKYTKELSANCDDLTSWTSVQSTGQYGTLNRRKPANSDDVTSVQNGRCDRTQNGGDKELVFTLHHDTRYEESDLNPLHELPPEILLKIFASLLLERKVILISCVISKLSCCVDSLQSILYPFSWPHVFIPILPQGWWEVVESPTPIICGILSVAVVNQHKIEHGIVVDLDERSVVSEMGDEHYILSDSMKKSWLQGYNLAKTVASENYVHSVYLIDAYIKVFIAALKHYKNHIIDGKFDNEGFIRQGKTRGIRRFLKLFTETAMFITFIDTVIANPDSFKLFDHKIEMYGSEESNVIMTKLMEWKK